MYDYKVEKQSDGLCIDFIPTWEKQRSNYKLGLDANPVTMRLQCVTMQDSEEWSRRAFQLKQPRGVSEDDMPSDDENNLEITKQQIIGGIVGVKNLKFNGEDIATGSELWGTPYKDLIIETGRAIANWSVLTAGDVRNLRLALVGS